MRAGTHIFFTNPHSPTRSLLVSCKEIYHVNNQIVFRGDLSEGRTASQLTLASGAEWTHGIARYSNILFFNQVNLLKVFGAPERASVASIFAPDSWL
jgi:hypothetical protein